MAKKISNKEFIDDDFLEPAIKNTKEFLSVINELFNSLKEGGKEGKKALEGLNPSDNVKDSNKLNEVLEKFLKLQEQLNSLQKDKAKTEKTLKTLQEKKIKQDKEALQLATQEQKVIQEKNKILLQEKKIADQVLKTTITSRKERERQFKEREKERKQRKKVLTEYQKESRRLTELRNKYKELAVAEKENTKEAKDLLKEVTKLDKKLKEIDETVGQNQRSVGNYEKALEGLNSTIGKLGVVAAISKGIELLGSAFGDTREGALTLQIAFSKFTETAKVFIQSVISSGAGVSEIFSSITTSVSNSFKETALEAEIFQKKLKETFLFGDAAKEAQEEIAVLEAELKKLEETETGESIAGGIEKIKKAFEGNVDVTSKAIDSQKEFLELQLATTISISEQEKALAGLAEQRQILQDISDDDTLGFIERAKFVKLAQDAAIEFAKLDNKLALDKEKLTIEAIKQDLRRSKALSESQIQAIQTGEQLQKILENEAVARKVSDANDEAFSAAFIERVDKQVEAEAFRRDQEEKNRKTARDGFEQELDIIEEFGEKRIELNQKIIDSDESSIEQRQKALLENEQLEQQLFEQSIKRIIEQGKASIQLRKDLTQAEKDQRKALLDTADIQAIVNAETETERLALIKNLDLGEIETTRLKDSIKLNNDLTEARRESTKAIDEATLKTEELQKEILLQEEALSGKVKDIESERLKDQQENLEKRIELLKKDSIKRLELEKQLNDLKLDEQEKANEKEEEETENSAEKRADIIETASEIATEIIQKNGEKRLKAIDDQLSAVEERQSSLRALAENGNEEAVKSLAESEKEEAKIRQEKEKELKRQQQIEAGLAAFKLLGANAEQDPNTALSKTFTDITLLSSLISSLPSFFVGTEDTGKAGKTLDSNGGRLSILHDNERVMTAEQNKKLGGISNSDLVDLATSPRENFVAFGNKEFQNVNGVNVADNSNLESIMKENTEILKRLPSNMARTNDSFDSKTGVFTSVMKYNNTKRRTHKKLFTPIRKS